MKKSDIKVGATTPKLTPQAAAVLKYLKYNRAGGISGYEALAVFRIVSLTSRISSLRKAGIPIKAVAKKDTLGKRYVRYHFNG